MMRCFLESFGHVGIGELASRDDVVAVEELFWRALRNDLDELGTIL